MAKVKIAFEVDEQYAEAVRSYVTEAMAVLVREKEERRILDENKSAIDEAILSETPKEVTDEPAGEVR